MRRAEGSGTYKAGVAEDSRLEDICREAKDTPPIFAIRKAILKEMPLN